MAGSTYIYKFLIEKKTFLANNGAFVGHPKCLGAIGFGQFLGELASPSLTKTLPMY